MVLNVQTKPRIKKVLKCPNQTIENKTNGPKMPNQERFESPIRQTLRHLLVMHWCPNRNITVFSIHSKENKQINKIKMNAIIVNESASIERNWVERMAELMSKPSVWRISNNNFQWFNQQFLWWKLGSLKKSCWTIY